jgi:hypothetical protein
LCQTLVWILFLASLPDSAGREVTQQREEGSVFVGAIGCRSSSCHGGAGEKRSQYITWSRQDFHSRAPAILLNARSVRIAEGIGVTEPQTSARCTSCHAPFQGLEQSRLMRTAHPDEGVSCESCHGAARSWLRGHTRPDWTYATRVKAGMRDLRNLYVRANTCVACHQNLDHDLVKAGHPTLLFELDSQSANQPRHWREEDSWSGLRAWLTGQAVALREAAWAARSSPDPAPDTQETSMALAWLLARVTLTEPDLPKVAEPTTSDLEQLQKDADRLARGAARWDPNSETATLMLRALAETDAEFSGTSQSTTSLVYRARRLTLALDRLIAALNGNNNASLQLESELKQLRQDVAPGGNFEASRFTEHLRVLRQKL